MYVCLYAITRSSKQGSRSGKDNRLLKEEVPPFISGRVHVAPHSVTRSFPCLLNPDSSPVVNMSFVAPSVVFYKTNGNDTDSLLFLSGLRTDLEHRRCLAVVRYCAASIFCCAAVGCRREVSRHKGATQKLYFP